MKPKPAFNVEAFLNSTGAGNTMATYRPGDVIFSQGDASNSVMFLQAGAVKVSVLSHSGQEGVVAMLESGDFFGESALAGRPDRPDVATAMTPTAVLIIPTRQMVRLLHTGHALADRFITHMLVRNTRMEQDLIDHLFNWSEKRLARTLLLLAHYGKPGKTQPVLPRISQETLAHMIGTTRSRVNFFMNRFKKLGFIEYGGRVRRRPYLKVNDSLLTVILHAECVEARPWKTA